MTHTDTALMRASLRTELADLERDPGHVETLAHADGSFTVISLDESGEWANPREDDGNVSTLINCNSRTIAIDTDTAGLEDAWDRWGWTRHASLTGGNRSDRAVKAVGRVGMMRRYLAMFRPDIVHFEDYWTAGDSYGWGYVTADAWRAAMGADYVAAPVDESTTPADAFASEVDMYGQWARGEVYCATHLEPGAPLVAFGDHGAYVDGYAVESDTVCGFLGYEDLADIGDQFTDSPVTDRGTFGGAE